MLNQQPSRTVLYARVSTAGQDVGLQLQELRQVAQQRGWTVTGEYVDVGISGATESRPELDRLMADAKTGKFDLLLIWKLDRLGRSLQHLLHTLQTLTECGVSFTSIRDPGIDNASPSGRLMLQILGAFAEFERGLIRERVTAGIARARAEGTHCGRPKQMMDLRPALALIKEGRTLRETADILRVDRNTLRRRLREAGEWPRSTS